ncbi:MAG: alpha/beta hydrolase [Clostridia bacterium]|nr:alpha/beta hydrolase [Clostridia bacterium]
MNKAAIDIQGKGGNPEYSEIYRSLFKGYDVTGFDYRSEKPWDAKKEFSEFLGSIKGSYDSVTVIANSIGAYFLMLSDAEPDRTFLISPIADMEKLILNMMVWAGVSEDTLKEKKEIETSFGEILSYDYLNWVRENPVRWNKKVEILYGSDDNMQSYDTIRDFAERTGSNVTVMEGGEHWFHKEEQMEFLLNWIKSHI